jgi:hypothetical protein
MNPDHGNSPSEDGPIPSVGRPGQLGVSSPFDGDADARIDMLTRAGLSSATVPTHALGGEDPDAAANWLEEGEQRHCLIFWHSPVTVLARAMAEGLGPDDALAQWQPRAEGVLAAIRRNRRRFTLVETSLACAHPDLLVERLNQRLALALTPPGHASGALEDHDPVELLIAERAVRSSAQAHRLVQELRATSLPLTQWHDDVLPDALTAWQRYGECSKAGLADSERLREENRKLRDKQQALQQQLEQREQSTSPEQSSAYEDLQEENELLLQQLHHVQEELESYYLESRDIQQKYEKAESQRKKFERDYNTALQRAGMLQKKIDAMRASRSWRITKPLRAGNLFKRKKKN